jgi:hypothetical protein
MRKEGQEEWRSAGHHTGTTQPQHEEPKEDQVQLHKAASAVMASHALSARVSQVVTLCAGATIHLRRTMP